MIKPSLCLIQARSTNPDDTCFVTGLWGLVLTFNEINCEYSQKWKRWIIESSEYEYDSYTRTPEQEAIWLKVVEQYLRNFEKDIK